VVTARVVDAPAGSATEVFPLEAKTADATCGTDERFSVAVRVALLTFVIRKTLEKVLADGTVPRSRRQLRSMCPAVRRFRARPKSSCVARRP